MDGTNYPYFCLSLVDNWGVKVVFLTREYPQFMYLLQVTPRHVRVRGSFILEQQPWVFVLFPPNVLSYDNIIVY